MRVKAIPINSLKKNHPAVIMLISTAQKCAKKSVAMIKKVQIDPVLVNVTIPAKTLHKILPQLPQL